MLNTQHFIYCHKIKPSSMQLSYYWSRVLVFEVSHFSILEYFVQVPLPICQVEHARVIATLESGIEVGPTVINLAFFSRPYGLIRDYIKVIQMVIYYIGHVYLRPYVYSFCQIFQALRLFPALRLLRTLEQVRLGQLRLGLVLYFYFMKKKSSP